MERLAGEGRILFSIDSRREGVIVPVHLLGLPRLVLAVGWNLYPPITDLTFSEEALSGTLSFSGKPFFCSIPWEALYAVSGTSDICWSDDVPPELRHAVPVEKPKRHLKLVN